MEINFIGHASFKIKGKGATVVTDPYDPDMIGLKYPKTEANIVTVSHGHGDHNFTRAVSDYELVINGPGEYEVRGVKILGVPSYHDTEKGAKRGKNTIYRIEIDRISIVHLGDLGHKLTDEQIDSLDGIDILLVPVGGFYTINSEEAAFVVSQLEPKIIIPMHYSNKDLKDDLREKLSPVSIFLKEMGKANISSQPKLSITRDKLPVEPMVVVLE